MALKTNATTSLGVNVLPGSAWALALPFIQECRLCLWASAFIKVRRTTHGKLSSGSTPEAENVILTHVLVVEAQLTSGAVNYNSVS